MFENITPKTCEKAPLFENMTPKTREKALCLKT